MENCCSMKKKMRTEAEQKRLVNRLARIEGQIRGLRAMVEEDAYCPDILVQVSAATNALSSFGRELLSAHIRTCVTEDIKNGKGETVDELLLLLQKMMQ